MFRMFIALLMIVVFSFSQAKSVDKHRVVRKSHHSKKSKKHSKSHATKHTTKHRHSNKHKIIRHQKPSAPKPPHVYTSSEKRQLIEAYKNIQKMWLLSNDYYHGITVKADPAKAFAWWGLYVETLPGDYPGLWRRLDKLRGQLDKSQRISAFRLMRQYREKYSLNSRMSEKDLTEAFNLTTHALPSVDSTLPEQPANTLIGKISKKYGHLKAEYFVLEHITKDDLVDNDLWQQQLMPVQTNGFDTFYAKHLAPGQYRLTMLKPGFLPYHQTFTMTEHNFKNLGRIQLVRSNEISDRSLA